MRMQESRDDIQWQVEEISDLADICRINSNNMRRNLLQNNENIDGCMDSILGDWPNNINDRYESLDVMNEL